MSLPSAGITIKVLFFAAARDAVDGKSQIDVTLMPTPLNGSGTTTTPDESLDRAATTITSNTIRDYLIQEYPKLHQYIHRDITSITMALNEVYIPYGTDVPIQHNDVIAIIPPISGG